MIKRTVINIYGLGEKMNLPRYWYATLGMLAGSTVGAIIGAVLFSLTGHSLYLAITGMGGGMGLSLGAALDQYRKIS
jgi:hypothetical protein